MARFDISPFVARDPGIVQFDFARGFRDLARQELDKKRMAQQQSQFDANLAERQAQRTDQRSQWAATTANQHLKNREAERAKRQAALDATVQKARELVASGDWNGADALVGRITELGGKASKELGPDGRPVYRFESVQQPGEELQTNPEIIENETFNPPASSLFTQKNPFDSETIPTQETELAEQPSQQQFDPYKLDTSQLQNQTNLRLNPFLQSIKGAIPHQYQSRVESINQGALQLGLPVEDTLKHYQAALNTSAGLMRSEEANKAAQQRLNITLNNQGENRNIRLEGRAWNQGKDVAKDYQLAANKSKALTAKNAIDLLSQHNPASDVQVVAMLFKMNQSGVMTDKDFEHASQGIKTIWDQIKAGVNEKVIASGLNPDTRADMADFLRQSSQQSNNAILEAQDQMMIGYRMAGSDEERRTILRQVAQMIPQALWSDEVRQEMQKSIPQKSGSVDPAGNYPVNAGAPPAIARDENDEAEDLLNQ